MSLNRRKYLKIIRSIEMIDDPYKLLHISILAEARIEKIGNRDFSVEHPESCSMVMIR